MRNIATGSRRSFLLPLVVSHLAVFIVGALFYRWNLWPFGKDYRALLENEKVAGFLNFLSDIHAGEWFIVILLVYLIARVRSRLAIVLGVLGFLYIGFWGAWIVSDMLTGVGINQSVVYHLFSGTEGADYSQFLREIGVAGIFLSLAVLVLVFSWCVGRHPKRMDEEKTRYLPFFLGIVLVVSAWIVSPWQQDILALADTYSSINSDEARQLEAMYVIAPRTIENKKNLVVLYLESVESTYFNERLFPGLLPNLTRLREKSHYFSGIEQSPGAGWTIAGMVNTQCGLPLVTPGPDVNDMGHVQAFLPEAKCLGEYLSANGYYTEYIGGASGKFAGKSGFLSQHGFMKVKDKAFFQNEQPLPESAFSGWGVYDDSLLSIVHDEFRELSSKPQPFALFALTMDTHPPHGHTPPRCEGLHYGDGSLRTLNALHCTDWLVGEFIERITGSEYFENTTLVVLSDHLAMVNDARDLLEQAPRRENLLMMFDSSLPAGEQHVQGTMIDVGPTVLDVLDTSETRLGFGHSLLRPDAGGASYTSAYFDGESLAGYLSFSRSLWNMPSIIGRIYTNGKGEIVLGESLVDAPFFSVLDSKNNVVEIYFYNFAEKLDELQEGARYLYALSCEEAHGAEHGVCLVSGLKGISEKVFSPAELGQGVRAADIL